MNAETAIDLKISDQFFNRQNTNYLELFSGGTATNDDMKEALVKDAKEFLAENPDLEDEVKPEDLANDFLARL